MIKNRKSFFSLPIEVINIGKSSVSDIKTQAFDLKSIAKNFKNFYSNLAKILKEKLPKSHRFRIDYIRTHYNSFDPPTKHISQGGTTAKRFKKISNSTGIDEPSWRLLKRDACNVSINSNEFSLQKAFEKITRICSFKNCLLLVFQNTICTSYCTVPTAIWQIFSEAATTLFYKKDVLRYFTKFTRKRLCQSLFFNKVADLKPATSLRQRLWQRWFPVNFVKFLRTPFYRTPLND